MNFTDGRNLQFVRAEGTSAVSPTQIASFNSSIAYVASGGVVVCQTENGRFVNQRFFVANATDEAGKDAYGFTRGPPAVYGDTESESPLKVRDKAKALSCVALSPNGKVLAVGELGYLPRILLYSLAPDSLGGPFAVIYEHKFGVEHLAFSPDSRLLCSLGHIQDGSLRVWQLGSTLKLKAGNKCTSFVNDLIWHGETIIAAGLRSIRTWQLSSLDPTGTRLLKAKNILLGSFLDLSFLRCIPVESDVVVTTKTRVFAVSLRDLSLHPVNTHLETFYAPHIDEAEKSLRFFDEQRACHAISLESIRDALSLPSSSAGSPTRLPERLALDKLSISKDPDPVVWAKIVNSDCVCLTDEKSIRIDDKTVVAPSRLTGLKRVYDGGILTFCSDGTVHENEDTFNVDHEITAIERNKNLLFVGDSQGQVSIFDDGKKIFLVTAHSSAVNDILYFEMSSKPYLCSISRDRMIQIYHLEREWSVLQTIPLHSGNLLSVAFHANQLYVCGTDKKISVHKFIDEDCPVIHQSRVISLKTTPVVMSLQSALYLATNDKALSIYPLDTFEPRRIKLEENAEALCEIDQNLMIVGSGKALKIVEMSSGRQVGISAGHAEPILAVVKDKYEIISASSDGCVFRWKVTEPTTKPQSPSKVTRKVLPTPQLAPKPRQHESPFDPESPTPKLSRATLRRLEEKKKDNIKSPNATSPSKPEVVSPNRSPRAPTLDIKTPVLIPVLAPCKDFDKAKHCIDTALALTKKNVFTNEQKAILRKNLDALQALLGSPTENLLRNYSDQLVALVKDKLQDGAMSDSTDALSRTSTILSASINE